jgi:hypothetical protein
MSERYRFGLCRADQGVDAANVDFGGKHLGRYEYEGTDISIRGTVDRVTGYLDATVTTEQTVETHYEMLCKATNRMF